MKHLRLLLSLCIIPCLISPGYGASTNFHGKKRLLVVDSYHREYIWSQETNEGICAAMLKFGYFDKKEQIAEYIKNDYVETSKVIIKKLWLDAKRKSNKTEKEEISLKIYKIAGEFKPDLILLGDDDAAEYIGKQFLDTEIPVVFWGVNYTPIKYGLVDCMDKPGHNVTGVYQSGYYIESLRLLKAIVPTAKTFAVLADNTPTGRSHYKAIEYLARKGALPLKLVETVSTNDYRSWKSKALELQKKVDVFFIAAYAGLKDKTVNYVQPEEVAKWYIHNISIPEAVGFRPFVKHGMLCAADDSGYNQGYEAVVIANDILAKGANPATYPPRAPKRGPHMVNIQRAKMLGITLTKDMGIEEYIGEAANLKGN
ncbi:MAG: ABC transporter substrate binding protein [Nitrospirota bacterium]